MPQNSPYKRSSFAPTVSTARRTVRAYLVDLVHDVPAILALTIGTTLITAAVLALVLMITN